MTFAPLQTKEILTSVLDEKSQPDASCEQNKASPDVEKTDCKTASSKVPLASSERKKYVRNWQLTLHALPLPDHQKNPMTI